MRCSPRALTHPCGYLKWRNVVVELSARPTAVSRSVISLRQATLLRPRSLQIVGSRLNPNASWPATRPPRSLDRCWPACSSHQHKRPPHAGRSGRPGRWTSGASWCLMLAAPCLCRPGRPSSIGARSTSGDEAMVLQAELLRSYVPGLLASRFVARPVPLDAPGVERLPAAVVFADISGFTPVGGGTAGATRPGWCRGAVDPAQHLHKWRSAQR